MPKVSQAHRDARRAQILDAARRCFLRDGFHGTSMQDLFAEAGLSSGAVYLYFASKQDVIVAIAEENIREVVALVHQLATSPPRDSLGATITEVLDVIRTKHADDKLGAIAILVWSEALRNPKLAERFGDSLRQMRTHLADIVRQHGPSATRDATPEALTELFMAIIPGYILQLSLFGAGVVADVPDVLRELLPS
jgi:AcrR family transcriptional regulator